MSFFDVRASDLGIELNYQDGGLNHCCYDPDFQSLDLPPEIVTLFNAFPFGLRNRSYTKSLLLPYLPPRAKAIELADVFFERFATLCVTLGSGEDHEHFN